MVPTAIGKVNLRLLLYTGICHNDIPLHSTNIVTLCIKHIPTKSQYFVSFEPKELSACKPNIPTIRVHLYDE